MYNRSRGRSNGFRPELKFFDTVEGAAVVVTSSGLVLPVPSLVNLSLGTGASNRIGRRIIIRSIAVNYHFAIPQAATNVAATDIVRCILVYDKQPNGAAAPAASILAGNFDSYRNLDFVRRYIVLHDSTMSINASAAASVASPGVTSFRYQKHKKIYVRGLNLPVYYDADVGDITDVQSGNLFLFFISQNGVVEADGVIRVRYSE